LPFGLLFPFGWAALLHPYEQYMRRGSRGGQSLACWFPVTDGFTIPEVTSKQLVENGSHGIKIAKTGDFWRFSAAFAGPAVSLGAVDIVFVPLYGSGGRCHN
jgi:hypothetical protein